MTNSLAAKLNIAATFQCVGCETIAETQGLSTPPTGWRRKLDLSQWPGRCVTWRCAGCAKGEAK